MRWERSTSSVYTFPISSYLRWWDAEVVSLEKRHLVDSIQMQPSSPLLFRLSHCSDMTGLVKTVKRTCHPLSSLIRSNVPERRKEDCSVFISSGSESKDSEVTHQQCEGHRPRQAPVPLPGQHRPMLQWSAWATMLSRQDMKRGEFTYTYTHPAIHFVSIYTVYIWIWNMMWGEAKVRLLLWVQVVTFQKGHI